MAEKDSKKVEEKVGQPVMTVQEATDKDQVLTVMTDVFTMFKEKMAAEPTKQPALPDAARLAAIRFNNIVADLQFKPRPKPPFLEDPAPGIFAVDLKWTIWEQTGDPSEFHILRALGAQNEKFDKLTELPSSARSYRDDTVAKSTTYRYKVVAITARGEVHSEPKNVTTKSS